MRHLLPVLLIASAALAGCESAPSLSPSATQLASAKAPAPQESSRIEVGAAGFQPSHVTLGADRHLVFRRTAENTCATAIAFPSLGIQKSLPLNTDVTIDLPPTARGEIGFQCGMGMYRGAVVALERTQ